MEKLTKQQLHALTEKLPHWIVVDAHHLERTFTFPDFLSALAWVNQAAAIAEQQAHHPDLHLSWGKVRVEIWTHSVNGITLKDEQLARALDSLATQ